MSVIAFGSAKASPGVTTTAVALASVWPEEREPLIVEADPDGGSLAARFEVSAEPGLVSFAAAVRRSPDVAPGGDDLPDSDGTLARHTQNLPGEIPLLTGPPAAEQAHAALTTAGTALVTGRTDRVDLLLDCGRVGHRSPSLPLACEADVLALVTRPRLDEVHHLVHRVAALRDRARHLCLVTIGTRPYAPPEVADALQLPLAGAIPDDPRAARALNGAPASDRQLIRSPLLRAAREIASELAVRTRSNLPVAGS